jgi:ubiquinone/menaquinone biosynthesis C-methylase UbiE
MDVLAGAYDLQMPLERAALAKAVELAAAGRGDRLLDVATGTGGLLRGLARRGARPAEVVGVDRRRSGLALAAQHLPEGWRLIAADARRLPFGDGRFDVVTAGYLLHLLDRAQRAAALAEIARVLRPGGRVVAITVGSRRSLSRRLLAVFPRSSGLRPLEPASDLAAAGLSPVRGAFVTSGWPSWCVLARRADAC